MDILKLPWFILIPFFVGLTTILITISFGIFIMSFILIDEIHLYLIKRQKRKKIKEYFNKKNSEKSFPRETISGEEADKRNMEIFSKW